jgi:hypothetical protein
VAGHAVLSGLAVEGGHGLRIAAKQGTAQNHHGAEGVKHRSEVVAHERFLVVIAGILSCQNLEKYLFPVV